MARLAVAILRVMKNEHCVVVAGLVGVLAAASAWGQEGKPAEPAKVEVSAGSGEEKGGEAGPADWRLRPWKVSLDVDGTYQFRSDLKNGPGSVAVARLASSLLLSIPSGERGESNVRLDWKSASYNFDGITSPWKRTNEADLWYVYRRQINEQWGWFTGGDVRSSWENGAKFEDSLTVGAVGGASYAVSPELRFTLGAMVRTKLEDNVMVVPLIGVDWQISKEWRLWARQRAAPRLDLTYSPNKEWSFGVGAGYDSSEFRLSETAPVAKGVGRDHRFFTALTTDWTPKPNVTVSATAGSVLWGELITDDQDGNRVSKAEVKPAAFVGLSVEFKF